MLGSLTEDVSILGAKLFLEDDLVDEDDEIDDAGLFRETVHRNSYVEHSPIIVTCTRLPRMGLVSPHIAEERFNLSLRV